MTRYWFRKFGSFYLPIHTLGWVVTLLALVFLIGCKFPNKEESVSSPETKADCLSTVKFIKERLMVIQKEKDSLVEKLQEIDFRTPSNWIQVQIDSKDELIKLLEAKRAEIQNRCDSLK